MIFKLLQRLAAIIMEVLNWQKNDEKAKEAGADAVKFQSFVPENLVSRYAPKAEYQKK